MYGCDEEKAIYFAPSSTDCGTVDPLSPNYFERDAYTLTFHS